MEQNKVQKNDTSPFFRCLPLIVFLVAIPAVVLAGCFLFADRQYTWITLCVAVLSLVPFFVRFERSDADAKRLVLIAIMVALSVAGRFAFAAVPHFKPVTAMVMITAIYFGSEAGFMTGALSALISNFYFGQGPWTPFQMLAWGMIGLIAGALSKVLKKSWISLILCGVLSGVLYSGIMDIWTTVSMYGTFHWAGYLSACASALYVTATYMWSNALFLAVLAKPIGKILNRITVKFCL